MSAQAAAPNSATPDPSGVYHAIIIGGGMAGLTAALYLARARCRVLVVEKERFGGQIADTEEVANYPGIPAISGQELSRRLHRQAEDFGAQCLQARALRLLPEEQVKTVVTDRGSFRCLGILLATGARPRTLDFPGEAEFQGRGISYCAACDGALFSGKDVFVIGGGYAAAQESLYLARIARHVTVLMRSSSFRCPPSAAQAVLDNPDITVLPNTQVLEVTGRALPETLRYENCETGEQGSFQAPGEGFGLFVLAGRIPETELVRGLVRTDPQGYVLTDRRQETSLPGVFAVGDVCAKELRQAVTAAADGALAAAAMERYAAEQERQTGQGQTLRRRDNSPQQPATSEQSREFDALLQKLEGSLILRLHTDDRPASRKLKELLEGLIRRSGKLSLQIRPAVPGEDAPFVELLHPDGQPAGITFHGVPGGHELKPFLLGLLGAAGPGQPVDPAAADAVRAIRGPLRLQVFVTLTCSMCPELVTAVQQMAQVNPKIRAEIYDLSLFPAFQKKYQIFSVPCLVVNETHVLFGRRNLPQLLQALLPLLPV